MKNTLKNTIIAIISAPLATFAVSQDASNKAAFNLPTYTIEDIASLPQPTKNPIPSVNAKFVGLNVQVKFTVTAEGRPVSVRLAKPLSSYSDIEKICQVVVAKSYSNKHVPDAERAFSHTGIGMKTTLSLRQASMFRVVVALSREWKVRKIPGF